jgi:hypothetical protein
MMRRARRVGSAVMRRSAIGVSVLAVVGVCASPALASGWSVQKTPNSADGNGNLSAVSCFSARACIAVGYYVKSDGSNPTLAERWNGDRWALQRTPNPSGATDSYLDGVSCPLRRVCIAVGSHDGNRMLVERWNGVRWSIRHAPSPRRANGVTLRGVSCSSARACTAVGSYHPLGSGDQYRTLAERWNGRRWTIQRTPRERDSFLDGVSCSSSRACTAVGVNYRRNGRTVTLAERWNGVKWTIQAIPSSIPLASVSCTSVVVCTAVGGGGDYPTGATRWDGTKWSIQNTRSPQFSALGSVACASRRACIAVGTVSVPQDPPSPESYLNSTLAERWNGTKWSHQRTPNPNPGESGLGSVSCPSRWVCTAVGSYTDNTDTQVTLAERWRAG